MTSLKNFTPVRIKGFFLRSLVLICILASFAACEDGNLEDLYRRPTCVMTEEEKQARKILDIDSIGDYLYNNKIDTTNMQKTASGIHFFNLSPGTGDLLKKGDKVQIHYIGKFLDGKTFESSTTFDNSYNANRPIKVVIGGPTQAQQAEGYIPVIEGWNEALQQMKVGEETRFYIPSYLAYGKCGNTGIPPFSVLAFDIKVIKKY